MVNKNNIQQLKNIISKNIDPLIDSDYCLLDFPDHKNIGDNLIWAGELAYLSTLPYKMYYASNLYLYQQKRIKNNTIILLNGGGNFGDIYRVIQEFRNKVIENNYDKKIIIFPVTAHYKNNSILEYDVKLFSMHKNLTICARDQMTYDLLTKHFTKNTILLIPDMAFFLNFNNERKNATNKILFLKRNDSELNNKTETAFDELINTLSKDNNIEIKDWPTFNISPKKAYINGKMYAIHRRLARFMIDLPILSNMVSPQYGLNNSSDFEKYVKTGVDFLNEYDTVYTTRLHVYILSILLDKPVYLLDNSYGKNKSIFDTWMTSFHNSTLIKLTK